MNNKKRIIIIILILFIIFFSGYFLIKNNDSLFNNTADAGLNNGSLGGNISKNMSSNGINTSNNVSDNLTNQNSSLSQYNHKYGKYNYDSNQLSDEEEILERVRNGVWWEDSNGRETKNVKLGKPYKSEDGFWLVGAFDKKTGKFLGSVWTGDEGGYFGGEDSYSEYKKIISGKSGHKSDSSKKHKDKSKSNHVVEEKSDSSSFHIAVE